MRPAFTACSAFPSLSRRDASTPAPPACSSCPRPKRSRSRSTPTTCASMSSARLDPAGSRSTPPTPRYVSRTCPQASWCRARTRRANCRTRIRPCASCVRDCLPPHRRKRRRRPPTSASHRYAPSTVQSGSGRITSRRIGSPTTVSASRPTTSTRYSTAISTPSSRPASRRTRPPSSPAPTDKPMSVVLDEVAKAAARLAEAGVPSPRADAEELAAYVHGVGRAELGTIPDDSFDGEYWVAIARRAAREPLQHITGRAYFRYLELSVGPGVFVPRPETESVVGWAIDAVR